MRPLKICIFGLIFFQTKHWLFGIKEKRGLVLSWCFVLHEKIRNDIFCGKIQTSSVALSAKKKFFYLFERNVI